MATRTGTAEWEGDLGQGRGQVTVGEGTWRAPYSGRSRFHGVLPGFDAGDGTNPEELLAAAHAACFTMALSLILTEAGNEPRLLRTRAGVHLRFRDGAPTIDQIDLETEGDVPGLDQELFHQCAEEAKRSCIVSRALTGVERIAVSARLLGDAHIPQPAGGGPAAV